MNDQRFLEFLEQMVVKLEILRKKYNNPSQLLAMWNSRNGWLNLATDYLESLGEECDDHHATALLNFYSSCAFCAVQKNKAQAMIQTPSNFVSESEDVRSLLTLGGGTLAQISNVQFRRLMNRKLTAKQRREAKTLHTIVKRVKMTKEEKMGSFLPTNCPSLLTRDRGNMLFPKEVFLPFVGKVFEVVKAVMNEDNIKTFGSDALKVVGSHFVNNDEIREAFNSGTQSINLIEEFEASSLSCFAKEWTRKIANARTAEFLNSRGELHENQYGKKKGGHNLRDELYGYVRKQRFTVNNKLPAVARNNKLPAVARNNKLPAVARKQTTVLAKEKQRPTPKIFARKPKTTIASTSNQHNDQALLGSQTALCPPKETEKTTVQATDDTSNTELPSTSQAAPPFKRVRKSVRHTDFEYDF